MQQDLHLVPLLLVVLCSTTACSFISTNKFVLDTNYSCTASTAVGSANERRQSPHHRSLFVSSNSDRCGGGGRQTMHPLLAAGLKVAPIKGRSGRSKGREAKRCEVTLGNFCLPLLRVDRSLEEDNPASLMKWYVLPVPQTNAFRFPLFMLSTQRARAHLFSLPVLPFVGVTLRGKTS